MDAEARARRRPQRRALADGRVVEVRADVSAAELAAVAAALERRVPTPVWRRAGITEAVTGAAPAAPSERWEDAGRDGSRLAQPVTSSVPFIVAACPGMSQM